MRIQRCCNALLAGMITLVSCVIAVAQTKPVPSLAGARNGTVSGIVTDANEARVVGARVFLIGRGKRVMSTTDAEGKYSVVVLPGTYKIVVKSLGFCPGKRADFRLAGRTDARVDFRLVVCAIANVFVSRNGKFVGERDEYIAPFREETLPVPGSGRTRRLLLIQYFERTEASNIVKYTSGNVFASEPRGVTITCDLMTLWGDTASYDVQRRRLIVEGNVDLQAPNVRSKLERVEIQFLDDGSTLIIGDRSHQESTKK